MKIFIVTLGSRGDVQPYTALGRGLQAAGHTVTLCTSSSFESFVVDHGLRYGYMNDGIIKLMNSDIGREAMENMSNLWKGIKTACKLMKQAGPLQRQAISDSWDSAMQAHPDLILFHPKAFWAPHFAEALKVPVMLAFYLPMYAPTAEFPNIGFPRWKLGGWYNKLTYTLVLKLASLMGRKYIKEWRAAQNISHRSGADFMHNEEGNPIPILHGFSPHVIPPPSDWPDYITTTGYWFLDRQEAWTPSPALQEFLQAGAPTVYVGFGSVSGRHPKRLADIVVESLRQANVRGVLASGWGGLDAGDLPDSIIHIDQAPHDWLFPQMAAVAHHGGAGTTAAGLRAGRPTIVCPFFGDQPFWGRRVHALGVGVEPIPQKKLTVEKLTAAICEAATNPTIRRNAEALGEKIRREDGIGHAVSFIEQYTKKR
ncbi:MAG: glycosyltransferase family 1 protein [Candidatus Omnitrophica bacterium]|nr:glycosyltransferase family 1 protein [Candidatus Omnitrophota bacterium]